MTKQHRQYIMFKHDSAKPM